MDLNGVVALLRGTRVPGQNQRCEEELRKLSATPGFPPLLLEIVTSKRVDADVHTRQAAAVYLKNMIARGWSERDRPPGGGGAAAADSGWFAFAEADRELVRATIVEAMFRPREDLVSAQLAAALSTIIRHDFPAAWPQIVDKIQLYLRSPDASVLFGATLALYKLAKLHAYSAREPLIEAMRVLLEPLYGVAARVQHDDSDVAVLLLKQILKILFALVEFSLPLEIITKQIFAQWMEVLRVAVEKPIPDYPAIEEELRCQLPMWKMKKWAVRTLHRLFHRYGAPGAVKHVYAEFAVWYLNTFSGGIIQVLLQVLDQHRHKMYVSTKVLQYSMNYITIGCGHKHSWKFVKDHMSVIIRDIIFPIMCHSDASEELFVNDPKAYLRLKIDVFDESFVPVHAARSMLVRACQKKRAILFETMQFCVYVVSSADPANGGGGFDARRRDGALHMVGALAPVLVAQQRRRRRRDQQHQQLESGFDGRRRLEEMLARHVLPECRAERAHMRARALWTLNAFAAGGRFDSGELLEATVRQMVGALLADGSAPVRFEAAVGLQTLLNEEPSVERMVLPQIQPITMELLALLRLTENDDLAAVLQKILCTYIEPLMPVLDEIIDHLAKSFVQVFEEYPTCDEKAITSLALLNTVDTIMALVSDHEHVMRRLQPKVLFVVGHIFRSGVADFYEDAFSLIYNMTSQFVDAQLWPVLFDMYNVFNSQGQEYFTEMMPALHNYITVDTEGFLASENNLLAVFNMCRVILTGDYGEDPECYAAKLLEIMILQCKGRINQAVPTFVQLVLTRLMRDIRTSELRVMCLQVVIAALYSDPKLFFSMLNDLQINVSSDSVMAHFVKQWVTDTDCFLGIHDRRLSIFGFCTLLTLEPAYRVPIADSLHKIMPSMMMLFDGLQKAYESRTAHEEEIDSDEDDDDDDEDQFDSQSTDEDEDNASIAAKHQVTNNIMACEHHAFKEEISDDDDDDDDDDDNYSGSYVTPLETYKTPLEKVANGLDEYLAFQECMSKINAQDECLSRILSDSLSAEERKTFNNIMEMAKKRRANREGFNVPADQKPFAAAPGM